MNRLPDGYLEPKNKYLTFQGSRLAGTYIDTGVSFLAHPWAVVIEYSKTNTQTRDQCLLGSLNAKLPNIYNNYYETVFGNSSSGTALNNSRNIIYLRSGRGVDRDETNLINSSSTSSVSGNSTFYIGAFHDTTTSYGMKWWFSGNIYSVRIMSGGRWIRNFIPAGKLTSIETNFYTKGMWDLVEGKWYPLQQGGGTSIEITPWSRSKVDPVWVPFDNISRIGSGYHLFTQVTPQGRYAKTFPDLFEYAAHDTSSTIDKGMIADPYKSRNFSLQNLLYAAADTVSEREIRANIYNPTSLLVHYHIEMTVEDSESGDTRTDQYEGYLSPGQLIVEYAAVDSALVSWGVDIQCYVPGEDSIYDIGSWGW